MGHSKGHQTLPSTPAREYSIPEDAAIEDYQYKILKEVSSIILPCFLSSDMTL